MAEALKLELVSPEKELASRLVKQVVVPGTEGEFVAMPGHAPLLSTIKPGVLVISEISGQETRYFVRGGYAEMANDQLIVLAERAIPLKQLDAAEIEKEIRWAEEDLEDARDDEERRKLAERLWDVYVSIAWMYLREGRGVFTVQPDITSALAREAIAHLTVESPALRLADKALSWLSLPDGVPLGKVHPGQAIGDFDVEIPVRPRGLASQARDRLLESGQPGGRPPRDSHSYLVALLETKLGWRTHEHLKVRYPGGWVEEDYVLASQEFWDDYEAAKRSGKPWSPDEVYQNLYMPVEELTEEDVL